MLFKLIFINHFKIEKTLKTGNQFKKQEITFQTHFHLFKKWEISLKNEKTLKNWKSV